LLISCLQTQLPPDYIELEKRVDALKQVHQKMLAVTCVHSPSLIPDQSQVTSDCFPQQ
jgi:hypothetical protein